jgi:hypothetical protein
VKRDLYYEAAESRNGKKGEWQNVPKTLTKIPVLSASSLNYLSLYVCNMQHLGLAMSSTTVASLTKTVMVPLGDCATPQNTKNSSSHKESRGHSILQATSR